MRYIIKNNEPNSLVEHRADSYSSYENIQRIAKEELKESLLIEQGYVCCYCMKRINKMNMKIEHLKCQSQHPELALNYKNMLGACDGNEGKPKHLQCCDTYKGDFALSISPLSSNCSVNIKYLSNGTISSSEERVDHDLNKVLNLNLQGIKNNRRSIIDSVKQYLESKYPKKQWTKANIQKEINKWNSRDSEGKYKEFYGVALFYLQKLYQKSSA